jgi:hypothetical protein
LPPAVVRDTVVLRLCVTTPPEPKLWSTAPFIGSRRGRERQRRGEQRRREAEGEREHGEHPPGQRCRYTREVRRSHSIVPAVLSVQKLCALRPATDSPVALQNLGHLGYEFSGR